MTATKIVDVGFAHFTKRQRVSQFYSRLCRFVECAKPTSNNHVVYVSLESVYDLGVGGRYLAMSLYKLKASYPLESHCLFTLLLH